MQHSASWWRLARRGSTFGAVHGGRLLDSRDTWFCAPDLCQGPDGAVYVCDFHDRRTAHPDPDARWDRSKGRVYRVAPPGTRSVRGLNLGLRTGPELVELLRHPNGWYADQAHARLAARRDRSLRPALTAMARKTDDPRLALQGLWGLHVSGGLDDALAAELLLHPVASVRAWTVRLLGDEGKVPASLAARLAEMASTDASVTVRCQLAATARRLPGADGLPVVERLLRRGLDRDDPYIPLMLWWAVEARALTDSDRLTRFFGGRVAWDDPGIRENGLRLVRRYAAEGTATGYDACARLLATAPAAAQGDALAALDLGLAGRAVPTAGMGMAGLFGSVAIPESGSPPRTRRFEPLTKGLTEAISAAWRAAPDDLLLLRLAMRAGTAGASSAVLAGVADPKTAPVRRRELLALLADAGGLEGVPVALGVIEGGHPIEVQTAALDVLARHGDDRTTARLLAFYPKAPASLRGRLREVLLARPASARAFLDRVDRKEIAAAEVLVDQLRVVALHGDPKLDAQVRRHWGSVKAGTAEEKLAEMRRLGNDLRAPGPGDRTRGKALFSTHCASCHKLFGEGGEVGPDLTGVSREDTTALLANIVDPGAVIRAPFLQYAAVTRGGRVVTGVLAAEDNAGLTLADARNTRTTLPRDQIEELRELPTSVMPDDLLKPLSPQDVRDLFRYLQDKPRS